MKTLLHLCSKALGAFAGLILFTLTVMIFVNVVLRYGFNSGITITEELGRLLFVWLVFAGAILAAASDSHVRVDMFIRKLPPVPKKVVATACDIIMIVCCYLITTGGWERTLRNMKNIMAVSGLPQGWLYLAGFLAGLFIGLILIVRLIARFFVKDEEPAKSAEEQESVGKLSPNALLGIMAAALVVGIAAGYAIGIPPVLLIFLAVMVLTIVMGVPIAFALITCGVVLMYYLNYWRPAAMATSMVAGADNFSLMAIPFFILAGEMMNAGGLSQRIVDLPLKLIGHLRGGLGYVAIIATVIMASLSGSAVADTAAVAAILIPMMVKAGYPLVRSAGLVSAGGIIAPIIPPSMPFIVFGVTAAVSIKDMFMGGIVPGLIMGFGLMVTWYILCLKMDLKLQPKASREEVIRTVLSSLWALFLPVVIIGGFRIGIFTATEAGAVAAVYSMFVGMFVYREMNFKTFCKQLVGSVSTIGVVTFLVAAANVSGVLMARAKLPDMVAGLLSPLISQPTMLIVVIMLLCFFVGMVMDLTPAVLILVPVIMPLVREAGINPAYFGILFIMNLCIGLLTPPVGNVLNVITGIAKIRFDQAARGVLPFLVAHVIVLALLIIFPDLLIVPMNWFLGR